MLHYSGVKGVTFQRTLEETIFLGLWTEIGVWLTVFSPYILCRGWTLGH